MGTLYIAASSPTSLLLTPRRGDTVKFVAVAGVCSVIALFVAVSYSGNSLIVGTAALLSFVLALCSLDALIRPQWMYVDSSASTVLFQLGLPRFTLGRKSFSDVLELALWEFNGNEWKIWMNCKGRKICLGSDYSENEMNFLVQQMANLLKCPVVLGVDAFAWMPWERPLPTLSYPYSSDYRMSFKQRVSQLE